MSGSYFLCFFRYPAHNYDVHFYLLIYKLRSLDLGKNIFLWQVTLPLSGVVSSLLHLLYIL